MKNGGRVDSYKEMVELLYHVTKHIMHGVFSAKTM